MTDKLIQQNSRHAVYVQRYAGFLANQFEPYFKRLQRELRAVMIDAPEETKSIRRINQITNEYRRASVAVYGEYNDDFLLKELEVFAASESEWQIESLKTVINSPSIKLVTPAPVQVWAYVNANPLIFEDQNSVSLLKPFIQEWEGKQITRVNNAIKTGFLTGKTSQEITREILNSNTGLLGDKTKNGVATQVKTMVRTATNQISNQARQKTNEDNNDIVIGYEIVATLDSRTSDICKGYDGLVVKNSDNFKPMPPFHPGCRTSTSPVLDQRYSIDNSDAKRASKGVDGGEQVSANESYYSWLKKQGQKGDKGLRFVQDVLGKERGDLLVNGGLSAERFKRLTLDELFQPIPLEQLKKKQSLQLAFDKIE